MKRVLVVIILLAVISGQVSLAGCDIVTGSGETNTLEMVYSDFTRIEVSNGFDVQIIQSGTYSFSITIDKSLYEYLSIAQRGDTLHVGLKSNYTYTAASRKAIIHLPDLRRLELSGGSKATVSGFYVDHSMDFELSGASSLSLSPIKAVNTSFVLSGDSIVTGSMEMDSGKFNLSGDSRLELKGLATDIKVDATGSSDVLLEEFPVTNANVELSGASSAIINVSTRMDINLSGASNVEYIGSPKLGSLRMSGGSTLNQK